VPFVVRDSKTNAFLNTDAGFSSLHAKNLHVFYSLLECLAFVETREGLEVVRVFLHEHEVISTSAKAPAT